MARGIKIQWTDEMIKRLELEFPYRFTRDLAMDLGISKRTIVRKARELGIEKEPNFLEKNRELISDMAAKAHPPHPHKGDKGWVVPNSKNTRFKKGNISPMGTNPEVVKKCHKSRNETIRLEKLRLKYDLPQKTKLKIVNIYS